MLANAWRVRKSTWHHRIEETNLFKFYLLAPQKWLYSHHSTNQSELTHISKSKSDWYILMLNPHTRVPIKLTHYSCSTIFERGRKYTSKPTCLFHIETHTCFRYEYVYLLLLFRPLSIFVRLYLTRSTAVSNRTIYSIPKYVVNWLNEQIQWCVVIYSTGFKRWHVKSSGRRSTFEVKPTSSHVKCINFASVILSKQHQSAGGSLKCSNLSLGDVSHPFTSSYLAFDSIYSFPTTEYLSICYSNINAIFVFICDYVYVAVFMILCFKFELCN